jgi:hypothetical protein
MRFISHLTIILLIVLSVSIHCVAAEETQLDPQAVSALQGAISFLEGLKSFEIEGKAVFDVVQEDGHRLQFERSTRLVLKRPDKLYAERFRDNGVFHKLWYDGSQVSILNVGKNAYTQFRAPDNIDDTLDMLENLLKEPRPLADLLYSDLGFLLELPDQAIYVGPSTAAGFMCDHLAFRNADIDWQLWVERSDTPFIRKVVVTYRNQPGIPQFVAYLQGWKTPVEIQEKAFSFTPPAKANKLSLLIPPAVQFNEGGAQ